MNPLDTTVSAASSWLPVLQWIESRGPYVLVVLFVLWLGWYIPRWVNKLFARYDAEAERKDKALTFARDQHAESIRRAAEQHAAMLTIFERNSAQLVESTNAGRMAMLQAFERQSQADRDACVERGEKLLATVAAMLERGKR